MSSLRWLTSHSGWLAWVGEVSGKVVRGGGGKIVMPSVGVVVIKESNTRVHFSFFLFFFLLFPWTAVPPTKDKAGLIWMLPGKKKEMCSKSNNYSHDKDSFFFILINFSFSVASLTAVPSSQASATVFCTGTAHHLHPGSWTVKRWDGVLAPGTNSSAVGQPICRFTASPPP